MARNIVGYQKNIDEMKTYFCIVAVLFSSIALVQCDDDNSLVSKVQKCAEEFSLTKEEFIELVSFKSSAFDNSNFRCVLACLLKKENRLKDGKVSVDREVDALEETSPNETEESLKEKVTDCANKGNEEEDDCEVAGVYLKCIYEKVASTE